MKNLLGLMTVALLALTMSCASSKSLDTFSGGGGTSQMASGNWSMLGTLSGGGTLVLGGDLTASGTAVSGNLVLATDDGCFPVSPAASSLAVSGTIASGTLPLTITDGSSTFTITLTVPTGTSATSMTGTYSVSGGCENGASGNITAQLVTGTVSGTWTATDSVTGGAMSLAFNVGSTANGSGNLIGAYPLTASGLTLTGPTGCTVTSAAFNSAGDSFTAGSLVYLDISESENGIASDFSFAGLLNSVTNPTTISGNYVYNSGGSCFLQTGGATLTLTKE